MKNEWIKCSDRMPENDRIQILCYCSDGFMEIETKTCGKFFIDDDVTHWMPLPEPPVEEKLCDSVDKVEEKKSGGKLQEMLEIGRPPAAYVCSGGMKF
jgi:hypothetical protein